MIKSCLKNNSKNGEKGITLIAIVVTIIVLLILVGISIAMLTGNNGILQNAMDAQSDTRKGRIKEEVGLWNLEKEIYKRVGSNGLDKKPETAKEFVNRLVDEDVLTKDEKDQILGNEEKGIEATGKITIDSETIIIIDITDKKIGNVYDRGDINIGDKVTYLANGQSDWIVFGKNNEGVLLTTVNPISGFTLEHSPKGWLEYESKLNQICSTYGGEINGKTITSRSITLSDINSVTGFAEPNNFNLYTFGKTTSNEEKRVNYCYPILNGTNYYVKATTDETEVEEDSEEIPAKQFLSNAYNYSKNGDIFEYESELTGFESSEIELEYPDNMKYVIGEDGTSSYLVALSTTAVVPGMGMNMAIFYATGVYDGAVRGDGFILCYSNSSKMNNYGSSTSHSYRPIVCLPEDLEVEEISEGVYNIVE